MRKIRNRPEQNLHLAVASFLNVALPKDAFWLHVPNGGARSAVEGGIFKAMGVKAGVPDILIIWRGQSYGIELKAKSENLSEAQELTHKILRLAGCPVVVCRTLEQVQGTLDLWDMPLRASLSRSIEANTTGSNRPARVWRYVA